MRAFHVPRFAAPAALLLLLAAAGCDNSEGRIIIRNRTGRAITSVTIAPCGAQVPGPNRLQGSLSSGQSASFDVDFGCHEVAVLTTDQLPGFWQVDIGRGSRQVILFAEPPDPN